MKKYKFIHIYWAKDVKFFPNFVKTINDSEGKFAIGEHAFVVKHQNVYDALKKYENIILDTTDDCMINKYAPYCVCLFTHCLPSLEECIKSKKKYKKKTICRVWGGTRTILPYSSGGVENVKRRVVNWATKSYYNLRFASFAAYGVANSVDIVDIRKMNKRIPLFYFPYATKEMYNEVKDRGSIRMQRNDNNINVLVGHRGTNGESHKKIIEYLTHFKNNRIKMYVILSYGNNQYIQQLKSWISKRNNPNIIVVDQFMESSEYNAFLNKMDIAVFDEFRSSALGNVTRLLGMHKKIYLNRDGVIKEAFDLEGIPYGIVDEIPTLSLEEFCHPVDYSQCKEGSLNPNMDKAKWMFKNLHNLFDFASHL